MINEPTYKTTAQKFNYGMDFIDQLPGGVSLASCTVSAYDITADVVDNTILTSLTATVSGTIATAGIKDGTPGHDYKVIFKGTGADAFGTKTEEGFLLRVREI